MACKAQAIAGVKANEAGETSDGDVHIRPRIVGTVDM